MDANTLTGQLRRGRGLGLRRALAGAGTEAVDAVYGCVIDDPRDDHQVEARSWYLTRLITGLGLDCAPIVAHLLAPVAEADDDEWRISLTVDVLADLAHGGDTRALEGLRRYVTDGRYWSWALSAMWREDDTAMCDGLAPAVLARVDDEELRRIVDARYGPWSVWAAAAPRIRAALDGRRAARDQARAATGDAPCTPSPSPKKLRAEELVAAVERRDASTGRQALLELGRRADPAVLVLAENVALRNTQDVLPGLHPALRGLGAAALDRARVWAVGADRMLAHLAMEILAEHGTAADVPVLLAGLTTAARERRWCAAEEPARGLGRLGVVEAVPTLRFLWAETTHSWARADYLAGLLGAGGPAAAEHLDEAADDCEPRVREYTIRDD